MDLQYKIFVGPYKIFTALLLLNRMSWWHFDTQTKISILKTCHVVRVCVCVFEKMALTITVKIQCTNQPKSI